MKKWTTEDEQFLAQRAEQEEREAKQWAEEDENALCLAAHRRATIIMEECNNDINKPAAAYTPEIFATAMLIEVQLEQSRQIERNIEALRKEVGLANF